MRDPCEVNCSKSFDKEDGGTKMIRNVEGLDFKHQVIVTFNCYGNEGKLLA